MRSQRDRARPSVETLDARLVMSANPIHAPLHGVAAVVAGTTAVPGDINGDGAVNTNDLRAFAASYLSRRGDPNYNPAADTNHNGFVSQSDVRPILNALAAVTPRQPFRVEIALIPEDQVQGHHPANSGGVTRKFDLTIVGRTTPNSIVFTDAPADFKAKTSGNYKFQGLALPVDSSGYFSYKVHVSDRLTQSEYLVFDPFGHRIIRAFPILRLQS